MNLKVLPFSSNSFNISRNNSKITFGEYDGDYYSDSSPKISKDEYYFQKELINVKYDKKRSSWLNKADELELSSTEVWKQLGNIEKMRESELKKLKSEFRI